MDSKNDYKRRYALKLNTHRRERPSTSPREYTSNPFHRQSNKSTDVCGTKFTKEAATVVSSIYNNRVVQCGDNPLFFEYTKDEMTSNYVDQQTTVSSFRLLHSSQSYSSKSCDTHNFFPMKQVKSKETCTGNRIRMENPRVTFKDLTDRDFISAMDSRMNDNEKTYAEKSTYCRPVMNYYNQQFIYKTMERNARLQRLVRKLVQARQREKQNESWNNYINDLKNKHRYYSNEPSRVSTQYRPEELNSSELIDDYCNTRFSWKQSGPCRNLLDDFYGAHNGAHSHSTRNNTPDYGMIRPNPYRRYNYENHPYCYPTSSQGRLLVIDSQRMRNHWRNRPPGGNTIIVKKNYNKQDRVIHYKKLASANDLLEANELSESDLNQNPDEHLESDQQSIPGQDDLIKTLLKDDEKEGIESKPGENAEVTVHERIRRLSGKEKRKSLASKIGLSKEEIVPEGTRKLSDGKKEEIIPDEAHKISDKDLAVNEPGEHKEETIKERIRRVSDNMKRIKSKMQKSETTVKQGSLASIENKLDNLINSINSFIKEIKTKTFGPSNKCQCVKPHNCLGKDLRISKSEIRRSEQIICGIVTESTGNIFTSSEFRSSKVKMSSGRSRLEDIFTEETDKSVQIKRDIEDILNGKLERQCAVQITIDIPTKERSTEVTDSLSSAEFHRDKDITIEEIRSPGCGRRDGRSMTIAVNTDPLGLLALLKISTETIKQILSYMPNFDYYSYLNMIQFPQLARNEVPHYICNICGASFRRPSDLSNHIQGHNLGNARDCCVCRHILDMARHAPGLFKCQYCGQRFTRAYCCELHQQGCARRLGRNHDVSSSLMLLR